MDYKKLGFLLFFTFDKDSQALNFFIVVARSVFFLIKLTNYSDSEIQQFLNRICKFNSEISLNLSRTFTFLTEFL